jgi:hypothetical protein
VQQPDIRPGLTKNPKTCNTSSIKWKDEWPMTIEKKTTKEKPTRFIATLFTLLGIFAVAALVRAQAPSAGPALKLTATSDNVSSAGETIKLNLNKWSTDGERDQFVGAWTLTAAAGARGNGGGARGGGAGRGGNGGGAARGAAAPAPASADAAPDLPPDPDAVPVPAAAPARGGGGGGRGGRGGGAGNNAAVVTPAASLLTALQNGPVNGYLWTSEVTGYAIRFAYKLPLPNGGQRIILATDRRLGASNATWKPAGTATPTDYEFTVMEFHLGPKGDGEGKASLTGKVTVDAASKSIALDGYDTLPVVFKAIKAQ